MQIQDATDGLGKVVIDFDVETATAQDYAHLKQAVYDHRLIVLKDQKGLSPQQLVSVGEKFGQIVRYYEPMYSHPDAPDVFVSSNAPEADGKPLGVPKTGKFWHSDYQFQPTPFSFTVFAPQILPEGSRGTFFIDMGEVFRSLPADLQERARATKAAHSVRRYYKIRPDDVYRPLRDVIADVEENTPPAIHNTVITHPETGEEILYISEGFTDSLYLKDESDTPTDDTTTPASSASNHITFGTDSTHPEGNLLTELLEASGQLDSTFTHPAIKTHPYEPGEVVIWDNRALCHRALHVVGDGHTKSFRVTVNDEHPFDASAG